MADVGAALESVRLSRGGDPEGAYQLLSEGLHSQIGAEFIGELGDLAWKTERWREAIGIFEGLSRSTSQRSLAKFRLGQSYEAVGEPDNALAAYRTFLSRMEHADPELTWVREAQEAVSRLGG
jgi:tetratricopeptide (TPR) repeat protein